VARTLWIGTSWKMTKTLDEARAYARALAVVTVPPGVQPFVLPAHTSLAAVRDCLPEDSPVLLGAQNAHWAPEGAGTGEVSMRMVADAGARLVEIGHSERREQFCETDETVSRKARAAVDAGLVPLVCVGEPAEVRDAGGAEDFVTGQVRAALAALDADEVAVTLVAYEPIWAIGEAGRPATPDEVSPVLLAVRAEVDRASRGLGLRGLLYGGSVTPDNAGALLDGTPIEGLFIGRAAWDATRFVAFLGLAAGRV
jgi:L-erythrulose 1-phosphate isomerase